MKKQLSVSILALMFLLAGFPVRGADAPPSSTSLKIPPMVAEKSVSTYVPSEVAGEQGLAVNVIYPEKPRYPEGAPVVVVVPQGEVGSGLDSSTHSAQQGFLEVRFAFPGGGTGPFTSGGQYDFRGPKSQAALRDVLAFAAGRKKDTQGRRINDLVPVKTYNSSIGIIGWSNGGNIALVTLSKYSQQLPFVGFLVFYESPLGSMFYPPALGGAHDFIVNRHYKQGSAATGHCIVDYRKLRYSAVGKKNPGYHKKLGLPEVPGILFFDENGDRHWDEELEFALPPSVEPGLDKQIYPPHVTLALHRLFPKKWPPKLAQLPESERYFQERDGSLYITDVAKKMPGLMVCVVATVLDHLQRQPDHPHVPLNYNGWLANKLKFVRLNPDPVYVGHIGDMNPRVFVDNKPNSSIDASSIEEHLEPEGLVPDYVFCEAAIAELADRKRANNFKEVLAAPIVLYKSKDVPKKGS